MKVNVEISETARAPPIAERTIDATTYVAYDMQVCQIHDANSFNSDFDAPKQPRCTCH